MDSVVIRYLAHENKADALDVIKSCYADYPEVHQEFSERFDHGFTGKKSSVRFIGAFQEEYLLGIAAYSQSNMADTIWELSWSTVRPEYQGKGIGKKLLDYRLQEIIEHSNTISTFAMISTTPTTLYLQAGFGPAFGTIGSKAILFKKLN